MKFICILVTLLSLTFSQETPKNRFIKSNRILNEAFRYYKSGKYSEAISELNSFLSLRKNHTTAQYYLAILYAKQKDISKTTYYLKQLTNKGIKLKIGSEFDFLPKNDLTDLKKEVQNNSRMINKAEKLFQMPEVGLISESVTYNPKTDTYYISSVRLGKIYSYNNKNGFSDFASLPNAPFSIRLSPDSKSLWVSISYVKQQKTIPKLKKYGLLEISLSNNKVTNSYYLNDNREHILGDFIFDGPSTIYISDSQTSEIYTLNLKTREFKTLVSMGYFSSLQGLVIKGNKLIVSDYSEGLFSIDLKTMQIIQIESNNDTDLRGIDGLYFYKKSIIATQNGFKPNRVIKLNLKGSKVLLHEVLEVNHPSLDDPTLGSIYNDSFIFVSNSGWNDLTKENTLKSKKDLTRSTIMKINLK